MANNPVIFIDPNGNYIEEGSQAEWDNQVSAVITRRNKIKTSIKEINAKASEKGWSEKKRSKKLGNLNQRLQSLNSTLSDFATLEISEQGYSLSSGAGEVGGISFNPETGFVNISFGSTANFVHESTHAAQYESGDLAFVAKSGAIVGQDLGDEAAAYKAQFGYDPSSFSGLTSISTVSTNPTPIGVNSFEDITWSWVQGITTSTGEQIYAPGGSSNTGQRAVNINSTMKTFIKAYPLQNWQGISKDETIAGNPLFKVRPYSSPAIAN